MSEKPSWENPFEVNASPGPEKALDDPHGLKGTPLENGEMGDLFPLDEAFFGPESDYPAKASVSDARPLDEAAEVSAPAFDVRDFDPEEYEDDEEDDYDDRPYGAVQMKRRRRTGLMGGLMYAAFVLGISTILAFVGWMVADDVLGLTRDEARVEVTIPENFTLRDVAEELYSAGAINNRWLFTMYADMFGGMDRIQPGVYQVSPADFRAIMNSMNQRTGEMIEVRVLISEGRTMRQTFEILEANGVASVASLTNVAETVAFDEFEFLAGVPLNAMNRLEGYLFPDTYIFFLGQNPESVIRRMLSNFDERMRQQEIYTLIEESPFTLHEIVNIASMIERETASIAEMPRISSVIWNRLNQGMHLGIDATIQYLLPEPMEFLTTAVIEYHWSSPYNTYAIIGLPYGPIANPGMAAIRAALQPENTSFLFYALHIDGDRHHFTNTYAEHNAFLNTPNFAHYGVFG
ncbi:MAG: endolytic transglycosylase MltG [Oscillospiraceae bacterium]|nr:endolytic transglycosylase MltG [Oscillospiraceae bacterium]